MKEPESVSSYIVKAWYDPEGQMIFAKREAELHHLTGIRGWGHIQHLFDTQSKAMNFQDQVGEFIAQAINEKIEREKSKQTS